MDIEKIEALIYSSDEKNQLLGLELDASIYGGRVQLKLEEEYAELLSLLEIDFLDLMKKRKLNLEEKGLQELPKIPAFIQVLECCFNELKTLPELPNIVELWCTDNELKSLPELPNIKKLYCNGNYLENLPEMPEIVELNCAMNQLASLPPMPHLRVLYCYINNLEVLPDLPKVTELYCFSNPLKSLPPMPHIEILKSDEGLL